MPPRRASTPLDTEVRRNATKKRASTPLDTEVRRNATKSLNTTGR